MEVLNQIMANVPGWLTAATTIITAATAVTAMTPSKADDKIVGMILKVLNFLAGNFGKNKNADAE
jgi:hypothetical protein